jgi:hypothetical protein
MKTTKELLTQVDKNGHIVDFIFCARCYLFLIMNDFEDEREIISRYCHEGDKFGRKVLRKINPKIDRLQLIKYSMIDINHLNSLIAMCA